ncbi:hypothetical protein DFR75_10450 [Nocardia ignorata]|uniref:Uncharacterized protein n=1 Tax=Nocardia ignorata TaxID=145285 RepID=A0A4R6PJ49_NOCIG|nr:hypothetical protein DFR75_10450 [Nocardia ignorata]
MKTGCRWVEPKIERDRTVSKYRTEFIQISRMSQLATPLQFIHDVSHSYP